VSRWVGRSEWRRKGEDGEMARVSCWGDLLRTRARKIREWHEQVASSKLCQKAGTLTHTDARAECAYTWCVSHSHYTWPLRTKSTRSHAQPPRVDRPV
jgi:hypothetical protein